VSPRDNLVRMPGIGCRFYAHAHCLLEEIRNPGYDASCMCTVLKKLEDHFEDFVDRADKFGIEELTAAMIWPRFSDRALLENQCPDFLPGPEAGRGECLYLYENACVLRFPQCPGRCTRFEPSSDDSQSGDFFHP